MKRIVLCCAALMLSALGCSGSQDASIPDGSAGSDASVDCTDEDCGASVAPLVMIVLDTSGSMERKTDCVCTSASCAECLPDCSGATPDKSRWTQTLEALTGTFDDFSCEPLERTAPDFTYDADYVFPYFKPSGTQRDDGVLQELGDRLRFGVATFDGIAVYGSDAQLQLFQLDLDKSAAEEGLWSYPPLTNTSPVDVVGALTRSYRYPDSEHAYVMDTGIRNRDAEHGALIVGTDPSESHATVEAIRQTLRVTRPYGSTPTAAALDDIRVLFESDPSLEVERRNTERKRHLILITDGRPDDDYHQLGCDCFADGDPSDCGGLPNVPLEMHCPYALPQVEARLLRCGDTEACDSGVFDSVHVIGLALATDPDAVEVLRAIARAGGDADAALVTSGAELHDALTALLDRIASGELNEGAVPDPILTTADATCTVRSLVYASGQSWQAGCNTCTCNDGDVSCTDAACSECTEDADCEGDDVCYLSADCQSGQCGPALPESCSTPVNTASVCACNGDAYAADDCTYLLNGVKNAGECD